MTIIKSISNTLRTRSIPTLQLRQRTILHASRFYSSKVECYISTINNPYINLGIEEWLLRDTDPEKYILYLWRNAPCIVIGRNQNPFLECNLGYMQDNNIPLVRRRSGGGAVYHDMGNSIYTIFMPREEFSRKTNAELVSRALLELDIPAYVNDRHDIAVDGFKVSGSAYKIINKRAYHHGTMLLDADTTTLKGCLSKKNKISNINSKGVESVPSPVTNLRNYSYTIDHQQFCESVLYEFIRDYNDGQELEPVVFSESHVLPQRAREMAEELQTWDWIYGQTPEFTNEIEKEFSWGHVNGFIRSRHGIITEADFSSPNATGAHEVTILSAISNALRDCRYSKNAIEAAVEKINANVPGLINSENEKIVEELAQWINPRLT